jgi:hypothetical protein
LKSRKTEGKAMTRTERILRDYRKTNPAAAEIRVDRMTWFYDIVDAKGNVLAWGDLENHSRGITGLNTLK